MRNKKGFTLIELLVVIAVIGLLSTIVMVSLNTARMKARDARRLSDLKQIANALEMFYDATGSYPPDACNPDASNADINCNQTSNWWNAIGLSKTYLGHNISEFIKLPVDPKNDSTYYYQYEPHCTLGDTKQGYWIRAFLEKSKSWYYIKNGIQDNDPDCGTKCDFCW